LGGQSVVQVPPVSPIDHVILGFHQRRPCIPEKLCELSRRVPSKALADVAGSARTRVADLVAVLEILGRGTNGRELEDLAFQLIRELPAEKRTKIPNHAPRAGTSRAGRRPRDIDIFCEISHQRTRTHDPRGNLQHVRKIDPHLRETDQVVRKPISTFVKPIGTFAKSIQHVRKPISTS